MTALISFGKTATKKTWTFSKIFSLKLETLENRELRNNSNRN